VPYYTGYMTSVGIADSPKTQAIRLSVENYLAAFNQASNRSYLGQKDYDSADTSAAATIAAANGARHAGGVASGGSSGSGPSYPGPIGGGFNPYGPYGGFDPSNYGQFGQFGGPLNDQIV
jgi:hypothetical protein